MQHELQSFRSGGSSAAGLPHRVLKGHGRWRSDAVDLYTWDAEAELEEVSRVLVS